MFYCLKSDSIVEGVSQNDRYTGSTKYLNLNALNCCKSFSNVVCLKFMTMEHQRQEILKM